MLKKLAILVQCHISIPPENVYLFIIIIIYSFLLRFTIFSFL